MPTDREEVVQMQYAVATDINRRDSMEDRHYIGQINGRLFMGIYDGHSGEKTAQYLEQRLHYAYEEMRNFGLEEEVALRQAFEMAQNEITKQSLDDGSCTLVVLLNQHDVITGIVGDSRAVVMSDHDVVQISATHRVGDATPAELKRIEMAGGITNGRYLMGEHRGDYLMLTRAHGDYDFQRVGVIAVPDIQHYVWRDTDRYLIAASDGLFDAAGTNDIVRAWVAEVGSPEPQRIADHLIRRARPDTKDNLTAIVIAR